MKTDLHNGRLFFTNNCKNTIKAMEKYSWDDYAAGKDRTVKEKPKDKFKDFADVVRYAIVGGVRFIDMTQFAYRQTWVNNGLG